MSRLVVCTVVAVAALVSLAGCSTGTAKVSTAGHCLFNDDCMGTDVCAGEFCRAQCQTDRDCPVSGQHCGASNQPDKSVCLSATDTPLCIYPSDCHDTTKTCSPIGTCVPQCVADYDCVQHNLGATCDLTAHVCSDYAAYLARDAAAGTTDAAATSHD